MSDLTNKLSHGQKHLLRLMLKDKQPDGWAKVSTVIWPLIENLPRELVELHPDGGFAKLTDAGETVVLWT